MADPDPSSDGRDGKTTVAGDDAINGDKGADGPELRLLSTDGSSASFVSGDVETPSPRSISFRQRATMHLNSPRGVDAAGSNGVGGNGFHPFAVDIDAAGGSGMVHSESRAKLEADGEYVPNAISAPMVLKTLFFILMWYTFSTCLTLYNKTLLGEKLGKFPAPLLMNTVHFTMQAVLSQIVVFFQNRKSGTGSIMTWKDYFVRVVPTALGTALDINLSNASLVFISVTFATMCKSASPIFLLLFAFAFRLESPSVKLFGIIFIISIGVLLTVAKETQFELVGFILVILSSVMSGFRWSMTQILLQKEVYGLKNPFTLMSYVAPVMAVSTLVFSLAMDPWDKFENNVYFDNFWHIVRSCLLMVLGGTLAFFMVLTEYILVSATSAVTVTIAGVVKEAVTILVAVYYFHDQFNSLKAVGLFVILVGVSLFNWYKYLKLKKGQLNDNKEDTLPIANNAAKYVILDDADLLDDDV